MNCQFSTIQVNLREYPQGDSNPLHAARKGKRAKGVTETPPNRLAHSLARESRNDPDLDRLIDAWPTLSATVKRMILAAIGLPDSE